MDHEKLRRYFLDLPKPEDLPPRGVCDDCGDPAVHHYTSGVDLCHPCDQRRAHAGPPPVMITPKDPPVITIFEED